MVIPGLLWTPACRTDADDIHEAAREATEKQRQRKEYEAYRLEQM